MSKLRELRELADLTQKELAEAMNTTEASISRYEKQEQRLTLPLMRRLAAKLNTTIANIAGEVSGGLLPGYVPVPFLNISAGGGGGAGNLAEARADRTIMLPEQVISVVLNAKPSDLLAFPVRGQSMEPLLRNGTIVVADRRETAIGGGGLFAIDDGDGLVVKWVQKVQGSEPPMVEFSSENPRFKSYSRLVEEANIIGMLVWSMGRI